MCDMALEHQFKKHRAQVTAADTTPAITEAYADLSAGTKALFKQTLGYKAIVDVVMTGTKTCTIRPFFITTAKADFIVAGSADETYMTCGDDIAVTTDKTRIEIPTPLGSKMLIAVTVMAATTVDLYVSEGMTNN